jgi:hypothetical protein
LYFAYKKKQKNEGDITTDVDFQNLLKKVDDAKK